MAQCILVFPSMARQRGLAAPPRHPARPGPPAGGSPQAPDGGLSRQPKRQDPRVGRRTRLRQRQKRQRAQTACVGRYARALAAVLVTAASVSDPAGARLLLARLSGACKKLRLLWVDGTYRGQLVEWVSQHMRFVLRV